MRRSRVQAREREAELFAGVAADELQRLDATLDKLIASVAESAPFARGFHPRRRKRFTGKNRPHRNTRMPLFSFRAAPP